MSMPGFHAEASLAPNRDTYRTGAFFGVSEKGVSASALAGWGRGTSSLLVTTRCCQWSSTVGRFVCTSVTHYPGVQCECIRTVAGPLIVCHEPVLTL